MAASNGREHEFHAEATALKLELHLPLKQTIEPQAYAKLHPTGGYLAQNGTDFRAEGAISYKSATTQVAGNPEQKSGYGWATLTTSVIEGLNILEVLTADRIVSQIFTKHPEVGYVPSVSFLGTRFENLCIAGYPVDLEFDMNILGERVKEDLAYSHKQDTLSRVRNHCAKLTAHQGLPTAAFGRYNQTPVHSTTITETGETREIETIECSLVTKAGGNFPGTSYGHVIHVPDFGDIYLATVKLATEFDHGAPKATTIELQMLEINLGCVGSGTGAAGVTKTNGTSKP